MAPMAHLLTAAVAFALGAGAQCLNTVAPFNPNLRTMASNSTFMVVPVPIAAVERALAEDSKYLLDPVQLLPVPSSDRSLFPNGFPEGFHPVVVNIAYLTDIRLSALQIDGALQQSMVSVPYATRHGRTAAVSAPLNGYISGSSEQALEQFAGLVPTAASGAAFGIELRLGLFEPRDAAYLANGGGTYAANVKWTILPNPLTGPGVYIQSLDLAFARVPEPSLYTPKALKAMVNQPLLATGPLRALGECIRQPYFLNNATAETVFVRGGATLGPAASGLNLVQSQLQSGSPDGTSGVFEGVEGIGGCAQVVAYNPEDCEEAVRNVNPEAL